MAAENAEAAGLAAERHFDDGQARYEPTEETAQHHDHIICEHCGKIVEFNSEELERQLPPGGRERRDGSGVPRCIGASGSGPRRPTRCGG